MCKPNEEALGSLESHQILLTRLWREQTVWLKGHKAEEEMGGRGEGVKTVRQSAGGLICPRIRLCLLQEHRGQKSFKINTFGPFSLGAFHDSPSDFSRLGLSSSRG